LSKKPFHGSEPLIRSATLSIVKTFGSSASLSSFHASGVATGAPVRARVE
jgi:hypothetical protein